MIKSPYIWITAICLLFTSSVFAQTDLEMIAPTYTLEPITLEPVYYFSPTVVDSTTADPSLTDPVTDPNNDPTLIDPAYDTPIDEPVTDPYTDPDANTTPERLPEEEPLPEPTYDEPIYDEPIYDEPVYDEPLPEPYEEPIYEEPPLNPESGVIFATDPIPESRPDPDLIINQQSTNELKGRVIIEPRSELPAESQTRTKMVKVTPIFPTIGLIGVIIGAVFASFILSNVRQKSTKVDKRRSANPSNQRNKTYLEALTELGTTGELSPKTKAELELFGSPETLKNIDQPKKLAKTIKQEIQSS